MKSLSLNQPHVVVMVGVPGSGKTFFAKKFADTFNAPHVSFEEVHRIINDEAQAQKLVDAQLNELLKTKQAIIIEANTDTRTERTRLARTAKDAGYQTLFVWVQTDPASSRERALKSGQSDEVVEARTRRFSAPHPNEKAVVISGKHTFGTQLKIVLKKLSAPRAEAQARPSVQPRMLNDIHRSR